MSTAAQIAANQHNAQKSSGPKSHQGKAISALNNFRHGFTGAFCVLDWEKQDEYDLLYGGLLDDHRPSNTTEQLLVRTMAQSYWLRQRALTLQDMCFDPARPTCEADSEKQLSLYLRYQTTHDRAFNKALDQLQKLRADKRKEEIGFESQQRKSEEQKLAADRREAHEQRRQAGERRAEELHQARVWLTEAQARRHETEITIAKVLRMPRQEESEAAKAA